MADEKALLLAGGDREEIEHYDPSAVKIVLVGKTGNGKSATGNTILGMNLFTAQRTAESVTKLCQSKSGEVNGVQIVIIDTPGIHDTTMKEKVMKCEIAKCIEMSAPGPHAFLLVVSLTNRNTEEENEAIKWIQQNFGPEATSHTILLFTHSDQLDEGDTVEHYLQGCTELQEVIRTLKDRYISFNNKSTDRFQVQTLLDMIKNVVANNNSKPYTYDMYKKTQDGIATQKKIEMIKNVGITVGIGAAAGALGAGVAIPIAVAAAAELPIIIGAAASALGAGVGGGLGAGVVKVLKGVFRKKKLDI